MIGPVTAAPTRPLMPEEPPLPGRPPLATEVSLAPYMSRLDQMARPPLLVKPVGGPPVKSPDESPRSVRFLSHFLGRLGLDQYSLEALQPLTRRIVGEYNNLGGGFQPSFVLDWGSYVDDNSLVVHLSLLKLNQAFRSLAQRGMVDTSLPHLVRHEMAHALLNTRGTPEVRQAFEKAFGPLRDYDVSTWRIALSNFQKCQPDYVSAYAQAHPHEDFAETTALYVALGGDPVRIASYILKKGGTEALERKFQFVRRVFSQPPGTVTYP